jgi:hypothetical protein
VILPLFLTAKHCDGEVQFMVSDFQMRLLGKLLPAFKSLSIERDRICGDETR